MVTMTPAYGRDYKNRKAAIAAWESGKDFIINDICNPYDGKPASIRDFAEPVKIRYDRLTKVFVYQQRARKVKS